MGRNSFSRCAHPKKFEETERFSCVQRRNGNEKAEH